MNSAAMLRSRKQCVQSLGSLTTLDAFECLSDTAGEVDTISDSPSDVQLLSERPEPTEASVEADLNDVEGADSSLRKILAELGFPDALADDPLLAVRAPAEHTRKCEQPPGYRNLFWRKFMASQQPYGRLTDERLQQHKTGYATSANGNNAGVSRSAGEWLAGFKDLAKSMPVKDMATRMFGVDIGADVARFVGNDALVSASEVQGTTIDHGENQDGRRVIGCKFTRLAAPTGVGRAGFLIDDEVSIATPHQSCSPDDSSSTGSSDETVQERETADAWWKPLGAAVEVHESKAFNGTM
mmetsp:Transcript_47455/g.141696  ORF Transcript_47455/g.141696 Transcript_47455/m.141696 type:complete len:298 (-) Transcript_47455:181-1074(-)